MMTMSCIKDGPATFTRGTWLKEGSHIPASGIPGLRALQEDTAESSAATPSKKYRSMNTYDTSWYYLLRERLLANFPYDRLHTSSETK